MDNEVDLSDAELFADSARGKYIPQFFAEAVKRECVSGVTDWQWEQIADPENEFYWDAWQSVEANAVITDPVNGKVFRLYQDGDLWMIPA